jgi:hypothetical protein
MKFDSAVLYVMRKHFILWYERISDRLRAGLRLSIYFPELVTNDT